MIAVGAPAERMPHGDDTLGTVGEAGVLARIFPRLPRSSAQLLGPGDDAAIVAAAQRAIDEDGAEVICLGCAGMGAIDEQVRARLPVPVIDGTVAAVKLLEGLIDTGAATSRQAAYLAPDPRTFAGPGGGEMALRAASAALGDR